MNYRKYNKSEDYTILSHFFIESKMGLTEEQMIPHDMLPTDGMVAETDEGELVGCVFLYMTTNSLSCISGFPIMNPNFKENRSEVINEMYDKVHLIASYSGYKYCHTWSNLPFVESRLEDLGYLAGDERVNHYIKGL